MKTVSFVLAALLVIVTVVIPAHATQAKRTKARAADTELERRLLDMSIGVDGAMGADLALKLLELEHIRNRTLRREACRVARARIADATEMLPLQMALGFGENREVERAGALSWFRVDALSLRCRLSRQLLEIDRREAREVLLELPPGIGVPNTGCEDILIPNAGVFYTTLGEVLQGSLTATERRQGLAWEMARRYVGALRTPLEIAPACKLVLSIGARTGELESAAAELTSAISRMRGSPRALLVLADQKSTAGVIAGLLEALRESEPTHRQLREALRGLVIRSLEAPRCADLAPDATGLIVEFFNEAVLSDHPIQVDQLQSPPLGNRGKEHSLYTSVKSQRMLDGLKNLNAAHRRLESGADRTEWIRSFDEYVSELRSWNAVEARSDADYVSEKTPTVSMLIELAPDGARRMEVVRDFASVVRHASTAGTPEYVPLAMALYVVCRLEGTARQAILEMFKASGSGPLAAYAALQLEGVDVFGATPDRANSDTGSGGK